MSDSTPAIRDNFEAIRASLDLEASLTQADNSSIAEWIQAKLGKLLTADSFESINTLMTETGLTASNTLVGHTLEIHDFALRESADNYRDGSALQKYAIVEAVDTETGAKFVVDGGGDQFVSGIVRMRDLYGFPFTGTLLAMPTGSGREMLYWRFHDPKRAKVS